MYSPGAGQSPFDCVEYLVVVFFRPPSSRPVTLIPLLFHFLLADKFRLIVPHYWFWCLKLGRCSRYALGGRLRDNQTFSALNKLKQVVSEGTTSVDTLRRLYALSPFWVHISVSNKAQTAKYAGALYPISTLDDS